MAVCALSWTLTLLVCAGVCLGQDLVLPARLNGAVGGSVVFEPVRIPPPPFSAFTWSTKGVSIIIAVGDAVLVDPTYKDRVSVDVSTLALELRDLRTDDSGVFTLSVTGDTAPSTADTALEVFGLHRAVVSSMSHPVSAAPSADGCTTQDYMHTDRYHDCPQHHVTVTKDCSGVVPDCHGVLVCTDPSITLYPPEPVSSVTITLNHTELIEYNSTVRLTCSASGSAPSFSWLNGSSEVTVGGRVQLTDGNRTLTVTGVSRDDSGPYTCVASNAVSRDTSLPVTLTVYYGPDSVSVTADPSETFYSSGSDLTLTCSAESSPAAEFQWAVNGSGLSGGGPELVLTNVQTGQSGSYTCIAHNTKSLRYSSSDPTHITVLDEISGARITGPGDLLVEGSSANLTCDANGTISTTEWMKAGQTLSPSNNIIFSADNRSVMIRSVNRTDRGEYRCTTRNPISSGSAVYSHGLLTMDRILFGWYGPDQVEEGRSCEFVRCGTESVPEPIYTWEFNRTQTGGTTDSLTVEQVTFTHSGNYTCTARNTITRREASAFRILEVKGKTYTGLKEHSQNGLSELYQTAPRSAMNREGAKYIELISEESTNQEISKTPTTHPLLPVHIPNLTPVIKPDPYLPKPPDPYQFKPGPHVVKHHGHTPHTSRTGHPVHQNTDPCHNRDLAPCTSNNDHLSSNLDPMSFKPEPPVRSKHPIHLSFKPDHVIKPWTPVMQTPTPVITKHDPCRSNPNPYRQHAEHHCNHTNTDHCGIKPDPCLQKPDPCHANLDPVVKKPDPWRFTSPTDAGQGVGGHLGTGMPLQHSTDTCPVKRSDAVETEGVLFAGAAEGGGTFTVLIIRHGPGAILTRTLRSRNREKTWRSTWTQYGFSLLPVITAVSVCGVVYVLLNVRGVCVMCVCVVICECVVCVCIPQMVKISGPLEAVAGVAALYECSARCTGRCSYSWDVDGRSVNGNTFTLVADGVNSFVSVQCTVADEERKHFVSEVVSVTVINPISVKPSKDQPLINQEPKVGRSFRLTCDGASPPVTIIWIKGGELLTPNSRMSLSPDNTTLSFSSLEVGDSGQFQCKVLNGSASVISRDYWIY
ncbi:hypothetical protein NFI96_018114 [Prochilodus magdalenae]|nr:hypothetical protein NFI96_018114 [Prochilodus magdalenae]